MSQISKPGILLEQLRPRYFLSPESNASQLTDFREQGVWSWASSPAIVISHLKEQSLYEEGECVPTYYVASNMINRGLKI